MMPDILTTEQTTELDPLSLMEVGLNALDKAMRCHMEWRRILF